MVNKWRSNMVKIEKSIPIPDLGKRLPLGKMQVGDSVVVPFDDSVESNVQRMRLHNHRITFNRKNGTEYAIKIKKEIKGFRVWRTQ